MKNNRPEFTNIHKRTDGLSLPTRLWNHECECKKPKTTATLLDVQKFTQQQGPRTISVTRKKRGCYLCYGYLWQDV